MDDGDHAGWIYKQSRLVRSWKKQFMVLHGTALAYYDSETLKRERGRLEAVSAERWSDLSNGLLVRSSKGRVLKLYTDSAEETDAWYHAIMGATRGLDDTQAQYSGWLDKQGESRRDWERHWFTLRGDTLSYYEATRTRREPVGFGRVRAVEGSKERQYALEIRLDDGRMLRVAALTLEAMRAWLVKLNDAIKAARDDREDARQRPITYDGRSGSQSGGALPPSSTGSIYDVIDYLSGEALPTSSTGSIYDIIGYPSGGAVLPCSTGSVDAYAYQYDGFQAAEKSTGLWSEPLLLSKRIPSEQLTVTKPLSVGQFGDVWIGQLSDGTQVAIKQLKQSKQNATNAAVFATEIVRMTQLSHPKITAFVGVEWTKQWESRAVVEYLPRGDLHALLGRSSDLDWADFKCQVAMDVVDALGYLYTAANGIVESFTSRNVLLVSDDGRCKLSVFAAGRTRHHPLSPAHYVEWKAPELILSHSDRDCGKAAIYSLGVLLCELDTMKPPFFDALNPNGSPMSSAKIAQLVSLGKLRPSVSVECPDGIASLASECLAFDPRERPTAASVAYRLRDVLKNEL